MFKIQIRGGEGSTYLTSPTYRRGESKWHK